MLARFLGKQCSLPLFPQTTRTAHAAVQRDAIGQLPGLIRG